MKFIVDSMLGDVARWLRLLGHDTLYSKDYEDWEILRVAEKENRTIVTRDVGLFRRAKKRGINAVYVYPGEIHEMLATIAKYTGIRLVFDPNSTRCPLCNTRLVKITKAEAISLVPKDVGTRYNTFWKCPKCGKIYWQGTHWRTISFILEKASSLVGGR